MADGFGFESYRSTKTVISESVCFKRRATKMDDMIIAARLNNRPSLRMRWRIVCVCIVVVTSTATHSNSSSFSLLFLFFIFFQRINHHFIPQVYQFLHGSLYGAAWGAVSVAYSMAWHGAWRRLDMHENRAIVSFIFSF